MKVPESHIDKRTPDEMLDGAIANMTKLAEWIIKSFPDKYKQCEPGQTYRFPFDNSAQYVYIGASDGTKGIHFGENFFHLFKRNSDGETLVATKYSESPEKIKT